MTTAGRRLERAIRVTPRSERERRSVEWRGDYAVAVQESPRAASEVSKGALRVAWALRRRQVEAVLTGASGPWRALTCWVLLLVLAVAAFVFGGPILLTLLLVTAGLAVVLGKAGSPSVWSHWLMVGSALTWVACFGYVWWVLGERVDAADEFRAVSPAADWGGLAVIVGLVAFGGCILSVVLSVSRSRRR